MVSKPENSPCARRHFTSTGERALVCTAGAVCELATKLSLTPYDSLFQTSEANLVFLKLGIRSFLLAPSSGQGFHFFSEIFQHLLDFPLEQQLDMRLTCAVLMGMS